MQLSPQAFQTAAGALQQIAENTPGERGRRASVVALVLRSVGKRASEPGAAGFLMRRAEVEVAGLSGGPERAMLQRVLARLEWGCVTIGDVLNEYAACLDDARRHPEAEAVVGLARELEPERADLALRAGRLARLRGDRERALDLYRTARELDRGKGAVARLAGVGEAVVGADPERALSEVIRRAVRDGDPEAAAVGLEERARVRRRGGKRVGAARDLMVAAARYTDAVDRGRVAHQLADLFVAGGDPDAAREALILVLARGDRSQREHARARLHTVSRDMGDQLGMLRWRSFAPPLMVSLSSNRRRPLGTSAAPLVVRWWARVEKVMAAAAC
jgi:tetratricopeptide (TPR) repeat protein